MPCNSLFVRVVCGNMGYCKVGPFDFSEFHGFYKLRFCPFSDASGGGLKKKICKLK